MKKLFKIVAILVAIIVVLLLVASVVLRIYLPPEKAKKLVLEHLSAQLKREVTLGSVSVGILSGLSMTDLKISESPTFAKGTFLSSEQFSLKVALLPLLFRKVIVRQILLNKPEVTLIRYADGKTFNFSDLTQSTTAAVPAPAGTKESLPFLLLISRADIQKGALHFIDRSPARQSLEIVPFDLTLKNVSLTAPFSVLTDMHVKSKGSDLAIHFAGEANLLEGAFNIKQASLVSRQSKLTVIGKATGLKSSAPVLDINIDIPQLNISDLAGFVALPPELRVQGLFTGHGDLSGNEKTMNFSLLLDGAPAKIEYGKLFAKPAKVPFSLTVGGILKAMNEADVATLKAVVGPLALSGHGKVQNLTSAAPVAAFHFETNAFPANEFLTYTPGILPEGLLVKGNTRLSADLSGTSANAQFAFKWDGTDLSITQGEVFAKPAGTVLEASLMGATAGPNKIVIKNLTAKLLSNEVSGSGTYETKGTQALINFGAKGSHWSVAELAKVSPLLAPYNPTGSMSFDLRATGPASAPQTSVQTTAEVAIASIKQEFYEGQNLQMKWSLSDVTPDLAKVNGTASLKQGPGKILNVEKLAAGSRVGKIALAPLEILAKLQKKGVLQRVPLPSLQSIPFDSVVGDYLLRSGIVEIKTFDLNGRDLSVQNRGTVGLAGVQPINVNVVMKLATGSIGGTLGELMKDDTGRPTVKFTATGTVADPKVKWDTQEVGKKALEQVGQEIMKNKDVQNAVDDLQKTFKGIFK